MSNIEHGKRRATRSADQKTRKKPPVDTIGLISYGGICYLTGERAKDCEIPKVAKRSKGDYKKVSVVIKHSLGIYDRQIGTPCWQDCKKLCRARKVALKKMDKFLKKNN